MKKKNAQSSGSFTPSSAIDQTPTTTNFGYKTSRISKTKKTAHPHIR